MFTHLGSTAILRVRLGATPMFASDECLQSRRRGRKGGIVDVAVGEIYGHSRQWSSAQRGGRAWIALSYFLTGGVVRGQLREFRLKCIHSIARRIGIPCNPVGTDRPAHAPTLRSVPQSP